MSKFLKSFSYALKGIRIAFAGQVNLRYHVVMASVTIAAGIYFGIDIIEWMFLTFAIGLVLFAELINTAVEYIVDFVSPEYHPLAGKIKDIAAGATLVAALTALIIGILIFVRYLIPDTTI